MQHGSTRLRCLTMARLYIAPVASPLWQADGRVTQSVATPFRRFPHGGADGLCMNGLAGPSHTFDRFHSTWLFVVIG